MTYIRDLLKSWSIKEGIIPTQSILDWVSYKNKNVKVEIKPISLSESKNWFLDKDGVIKSNQGFFEIKGLKTYNNGLLLKEQPIICQSEIGFLGFICKRINGILHFLVQAKIEPGNINKIQLSPTIQATKSNFEQKHGGRRPKYLEYFIDYKKYCVIVDQIQSEQSGRFFGKRNRNIIIDIGEKDIEVSDSHCWMTLGQIKQLMKIDNLVNMDTRTVLSCLPFFEGFNSKSYGVYFTNKLLENSIFNNQRIDYVSAFSILNNYKMFHEEQKKLCGLNELDSWSFSDKEFVCEKKSNFRIGFYQLAIEGREVSTWTQPLFKSEGPAIFCLFIAKFKDQYKFLVKLCPEIGCFDKVEFGPTIQTEYVDVDDFSNSKIGKVFFGHVHSGDGIINNVYLSEEGGRFYHEQNQNLIIEINPEEAQFGEEYLWLDYKTLNFLIQYNNVVNIQLRNLLSLLEV